MINLTKSVHDNRHKKLKLQETSYVNETTTFYFERDLLSRGGGRYVKLVVLLYIEPTKNVGGAKGCILSNLPKVGGVIAPPAPPVPPPLTYLKMLKIIAIL